VNVGTIPHIISHEADFDTVKDWAWDSVKQFTGGILGTMLTDGIITNEQL
jgi:hypothetical protein